MGMPVTVWPRGAECVRMADWAHLQSEFTWIYEGPVEARYRRRKSHCPGQSALLILKGTARIETELSAARAKRGQWVFPPQGARLQEFSHNARVLSVHFHLYWPGGQPLFDWDKTLVLDSCAVPALERQAWMLLRTVRRRFPEAATRLPLMRSGPETYFIFQTAFVSWLGAYVEAMLKAGATPSRLHDVDLRVLEAVRWLDSIPIGAAFDGVWLAAQVGISVSQLDRLFGAHFGLTPRQYFERRRLRHAIALIRGSPLSFKEVSYEVGFRHPPSFSRWFCEKTGLSPRQFRRTAVSTTAPQPWQFLQASTLRPRTLTP